MNTEVNVIYPNDVVNATSVETPTFQKALEDVKDSDFIAVSPNACMLGFRIGGTSGSIRFEKAVPAQVCGDILRSVLAGCSNLLPDYNYKYYETILR